jgi:serine protease AprX
MPRYAVISKGLNISKLKEEVLKIGGHNIKEVSHVEQIYCDLDEAGAQKLSTVPGLAVKQVKSISLAKQLRASPIEVPEYIPAQEIAGIEPTYSVLYGSQTASFYELQDMFSPPIIGNGEICAILDSGIRKTHRGLRGKVVREVNFSTSPTAADIFNHGTSVAYILCGGVHSPGSDSGMAPGVKVVNIKVLNDDGEGTEEEVVNGLGEVIRCVKYSWEQGKGLFDPLNIHSVNLSFGEEDDGDPDNPIRAACRKVIHCPESYGYTLTVSAAAGNSGPSPGTIMCPACDPEVLAVGNLLFYPFDVNPTSSRGPTKEGIVKPDIVYFGTDINMASAASDDAYVVKSGTSFSVPFMIGGGACGAEMVRRYQGQNVVISKEEWVNIIKQICIKPEGAPAEKDNTWGYGFPWGGNMIKMVTGMAAPAFTVSSVTDMVTPIAGLGMVGMMMSSIMKGMKF